MKKATKKIRSMSREEVEKAISACVQKNQTASQYYDHLCAHLTKLRKRDIIV